MTAFFLQWEIDQQSAMKTIKEFLQTQHVSKRALTAIKFSGGSICVNGIEQNVRYQLQASDILTIVFPPENASGKLAGENIPLVIKYEDRDVLVVDKPAGMNTIPSREHPSGSLANAITGYYERTALQRAVHIVTRLDRQTSGLVLIAKHRYAHHLFSEMQKLQKIERIYEAFAKGVCKEKEGFIEAPIGRKCDSIIEREVRSDGQYAATHYRVISQYADFCHLQLRLETGRTHQIRVHLSHIGHPLLGDELYDGPLDQIKRQALHCKELRFYHPFLHKHLTFCSALPADFSSLMVF